MPTPADFVRNIVEGLSWRELMDTLPTAAATMEQAPTRHDVMLLLAAEWVAPVIVFAMG